MFHVDRPAAPTKQPPHQRTPLVRGLWCGQTSSLQAKGLYGTTGPVSSPYMSRASPGPLPSDARFRRRPRGDYYQGAQLGFQPHASIGCHPDVGPVVGHAGQVQSMR